jgi:hypothetical protein
VEWAVQLVFVALLLLKVVRERGLLRALWAVPIPRPALIVCGAFLLVEIAHIALRLETFPFSPVAMYSNAVVVDPPPIRSRWSYVVPRRDGGYDLLSPERESTMAAKFLSNFDYKMAAVVTMYTRSSVVYRHIHEQLVATGHPSPVLVEVRYHASSGVPIGGSARMIPLPAIKSP